MPLLVSCTEVNLTNYTGGFTSCAHFLVFYFKNYLHASTCIVNLIDGVHFLMVTSIQSHELLCCCMCARVEEKFVNNQFKFIIIYQD